MPRSLPSRRTARLVAALVTVAALAPAVAIAQASTVSPFVGRWDLTVAGPSGPAPSWLEVLRSGHRTYVGRYVGESGSARPIGEVVITGDSLRFAIPAQWDTGPGQLVVEARRVGESLRGTVTTTKGARLAFTGARAPALRRDGDLRWGPATPLFNGKDLAGWTTTGANGRWVAEGRLLRNTASGANLRTVETFDDFQLHVEFRVPKDGNSGVYLRGRHEVQVEDSKGLPLDSRHVGGVYGFLVPNEDVAKAPGEWQSFDITLVGRLVTVVHNGRAVIVRQEIPGITGGALDSDEGAPGPILLQGDHTAVDYRNLTIRRRLGSSP